MGDSADVSQAADARGAPFKPSRDQLCPCQRPTIQTIYSLNDDCCLFSAKQLPWQCGSNPEFDVLVSHFLESMGVPQAAVATGEIVHVLVVAARHTPI